MSTGLALLHNIVIVIGFVIGFCHIGRNFVDNYFHNSLTMCSFFTGLTFVCCSAAHHLTVRRLRFRPKVGLAGKDGSCSVLQLASCGQDHQVKVYEITTTSKSQPNSNS